MKKYARLFGSAALLAVLAWRVDLVLVARTLAGVQWGWWLGAVLCYAAAQGLSSLRWQALAVPLGPEDELVCPSAHVSRAEQMLEQMDGLNLLVIGYSGLDREVLGLL